MNKAWSTSSIPDLDGKVAIVTGGNIGLGFHTSLELARKGAKVTIASRSSEKGKAAIGHICKEVPNAKLATLRLDLIDLDSVRAFAESFSAKNSKLDILVNNAGVVSLDEHTLTPSGQEMHMATNHLGHFALVGHLFSQLLASPAARVVSVTSGGYRFGVIDFDDFAWKKRKYKKINCYGDSKLANLLFMLELQQRFESAGSKALSVAAHPGLTATERHHEFTGIKGFLDRLVATPMAQGVQSQLRAATDPDAVPCDFYGPRRGLWGPPVTIAAKEGSLDPALAKKLWSFSEELTHVSYPTIQ